jgi:hypothetical protein
LSTDRAHKAPDPQLLHFPELAHQLSDEENDANYLIRNEDETNLNQYD